MDTAPWPLGIGMMKPLEELVSSAAGGNNAGSACGAPSSTLIRAPAPAPAPEIRKARPPKEHALNCPRCNSTNTKFCYYNNYSMTQPRYFCKTCRRYWTEGGSLRNVPVGGGSRKNKRSSSSNSLSSSSSSVAAAAGRNPVAPISIHQNPKLHHGQDLNLGFFPADPPAPAAMSAMDFLRGGAMQSTFLMAGDAVFSSGFEQDFRQPPAAMSAELFFPLGSAAGAGGGGRVLFPFEDLRKVSSAAAAGEELEQKGGAGAGEEVEAAAAAAAAGFWSGMMGGGNGGSW